jgi:hypothetical protein
MTNSDTGSGAIPAGVKDCFIEQHAPFPVVGGGWITRARKMSIIASRSASIGS